MRLPGTRYCPSCDMDVPLDASLEGSYLLAACAHCALGLGLKVATTTEMNLFVQPRAPAPMTTSPAPSAPGGFDASGELFNTGEVAYSTQQMDAIRIAAVSLRSPESAPAPAHVRQMRSVYLVEDSAFLRTVTRDLLTERGLAREIIDCEDGPKFIEEFTRATAAGRKPELVILDVRMPDVDGREAAYAMRAIEVGLGVKRTPILFFSAVLCDEPFKDVLAELGNAKYIRKSDTDPHQLGERIVAVLERLVGSKT